MSYFQPIYHALLGFVYMGMASWELYVATHYDTSNDLNDMARCFCYSISVFNILMGLTAWYISHVQFNTDEKRNERYTLNAATGINIWGSILYFRYSGFIDVYEQVLLAETCLFLSRLGITSVLICCCKKNPEATSTIEVAA